jgi:hypothetical protein
MTCYNLADSFAAVGGIIFHMGARMSAEKIKPPMHT